MMSSSPTGHVGYAPPLPQPRGPLSEYVIEHLARPPHALPPGPAAIDDPLVGDDLHLALYICYELHYRSIGGVAEEWEWDPGLLTFRQSLEWQYEEGLRKDFIDRAGAWIHDLESSSLSPDGVVRALQELVATGVGPSVPDHFEQDGTLPQMCEMAVHRSAYQLKEADPHTWGIPRLSGTPKAALIAIQFDEYGSGVEADMHADLFAMHMNALGLDDSYGHYLDVIPGVTLAGSNLVSLFGLHRRLRGALVGHLTIFEMTSVDPMRGYSQALERFGIPVDGRRFFDIHVVADAEHEVAALHRLAGGLAEAEPALAPDILFGAVSLTAAEHRSAQHLLSAWRAGRSSLLPRRATPVTT